MRGNVINNSVISVILSIPIVVAIQRVYVVASILQGRKKSVQRSDKVRFFTHLCKRLLLGDVSILGRFFTGRLVLVLLAEADRPEGPLFLHL